MYEVLEIYLWYILTENFIAKLLKPLIFKHYHADGISLGVSGSCCHPMPVRRLLFQNPQPRMEKVIYDYFHSLEGTWAGGLGV
ncbi:hypothetical protein [Methanothermobacter marburgensis]|uniref:Uncharacterized protein n=1 Tax=Methanothermobacter marburgensis (strain ATCC BAA-927 / DSM 2133 / JCM 14651 / NBRC 100331 / OCM 82 / Marburg) TaxID=79929 RepID=D9PX63_METTM|nr:hypothetical protein [Methanothermobacter marburgensis]ADL58811.1 hypothetical protein MTBMA_c12210 [Methanothermobacter marburgensis str. Marburg]WBF09368.1 hypothetical protein ISG34_06000 [Methanothermobacter marburgensis]